MDSLEIIVLSPASFESKEDGRIVLRLLSDVYPDLTPQRYGNVEPLKGMFNSQHIDEALECWGGFFHFTRKRPRVQGTAYTPWKPHTQHSSLSLSVNKTQIEITQLLEFFIQACQILRTDFALLHLLTEHELPMATANGTLLGPLNQGGCLGVTTRRLQRCIPDLYWATVFGPPYVSHFGREKLLNCPAQVVRELPGGAVYLQTSANPLDLAVDFDAVAATRLRSKVYLDQDSFFDPHTPEDHIYSVPRFQLEGSLAIRR